VLPLRDNIPTSRPPVVTVVFIAVNILVYFLWQQGGFSLGTPDSTHYQCQLYEWSAIPAELTGGDVPFPAQCGTDDAQTWMTPFTAMFMHGGLLHLGGNMLFLWIFGNNVEDSMGPIRFVVFYVLGGLAATGLHVVTDFNSEIPTLGASGAIAAVLGGYLLLFPRARVVTVIFIVFFFTIIELPALIVLGLWFLQQALYGYFDLTGAEGSVAYFAHIGGFIFGLLTIKLFAKRKRAAARPTSPFAHR
jgi:membrane associated rhomboid family serine protease